MREGRGVSDEAALARNRVLVAPLDEVHELRGELAGRRRRGASAAAVAAVVLGALLIGIPFAQQVYDGIVLVQAQGRVAALFRDAVQKVIGPVSAEDRYPSAQVVFGGGVLKEYVSTGAGWKKVVEQSPLHLPGGIRVSSWTFPANAVRIWSDGGRIAAWPGDIVLASGRGMKATVHVDKTGRVWYIPFR
jgi:hypothetical protein